MNAPPDRSERFNSTSTELWNIGSVSSHPPSRLELTCPLQDEILNRGYLEDLRTIEGRDINSLIAEKTDHPRHSRMVRRFGEAARLTHDELLAIICYTGNGAYRDVRRSAATRDWDRWPSFFANLIRGLRKLQKYDLLDSEPDRPLFHGISRAVCHGVTLFGAANTFWIKFMMPISTSTERDLALSFLDHAHSSSSLLLRFEAPFRDETHGKSMTYFADISWISQFPAENEVLLFPVGDCMAGRLHLSFNFGSCLVQEYRAMFSGDW